MAKTSNKPLSPLGAAANSLQSNKPQTPPQRIYLLVFRNSSNRYDNENPLHQKIHQLAQDAGLNFWLHSNPKTPLRAIGSTSSSSKKKLLSLAKSWQAAAREQAIPYSIELGDKSEFLSVEWSSSKKTSTQMKKAIEVILKTEEVSFVIVGEGENHLHLDCPDHGNELLVRLRKAVVSLDTLFTSFKKPFDYHIDNHRICLEHGWARSPVFSSEQDLRKQASKNLKPRPKVKV